MPQLDSTGRDPLAADQETISFTGGRERGGENRDILPAERDAADLPYSLTNQSDCKEASLKELEQDERRRAAPSGDVRGTRNLAARSGEPFTIPEIGTLPVGPRTCLQVKWPVADTERANLQSRLAPEYTVSPFPAGCPGPTLQPSDVAVVQQPHCIHPLTPLIAYSRDQFPCLIHPSHLPGGAEPEIGIPRQPHMAHTIPTYCPFSPEATSQIPHPVGWLISQQNQSVYPIVQGGFNHLYPAAVTIRTSLSNGVPSRLLPPRVSPRYSFHVAAIPHVANPRFGQEHGSSDLANRLKRSDLKNEDEKKNHIKKPLNAFMLYMKEMRAKVVSECMLKESAAINQILGRRWHALSREEQGRYYELAKKERQRHMQLYPGWSARDNYGKKKKRKREKLPGEDHVK
ncbi:transcription factor 7-like 2 [Scleropages formosus]|uniref:transcription factor 7-like 2 n=1 Tax=Scleropages formosus TaxID=113540 RepID=UPI0010FABF2E|nr:transcription factor 7-like 2 [Scleropages formosus]